VVGVGLYVPLLFLLHVLGRADVGTLREVLGFGTGGRGGNTAAGRA
jgi:hypothetical protein